MLQYNLVILIFFFFNEIILVLKNLNTFIVEIETDKFTRDRDFITIRKVIKCNVRGFFFSFGQSN